MKNIKTLLRYYLVFLGTLLLQTPVFLIYHWRLSAAEGPGGCLAAWWHSLPMALAVAGYLCAVPALALWAAACFPVKTRITARILRIWSAVAAAVVALVFISDLELYTHWGFRIDATVLNYLAYPKDAVASVPVWTVAMLLVAGAAWAVGQYVLLDRFAVRPMTRTIQFNERSVGEMALFPLATGVMFVLIRGGIGTSTMNVGSAYFSQSMYLNHAAVNPCFSLFSSMGKKEDFDRQYRFMDEEKARRLFEEMASPVPADTTAAAVDSLPQLLRTRRPDIVVILLESFGKQALERPDVTPHLNRLAAEGVLFERMYASSFRTDRGLPAVLSGYPAQPAMSLIKYPAKSQRLPSLAGTLRGAGYDDQSFLYGGDVNFAGIRSYIVSQGIADITSDRDFPVTELLNKWGAPDHVAFPRLLEQIGKAGAGPWMKIFLTLSSHEPFEVPLNRFEDRYLNSVAYTDECLGNFIDALRRTPAWDNTLLVLIPDHNMRWPWDTPAYAPARHDIFAVWTGGAVKTPARIATLCSQTDMAATLLAQLGIPYDGFPFSRDILAPGYRPYAFYSFPDGLGFISPEGTAVYDCAARQPLVMEGHGPDSLLTLGKAYLQTLFNDIQKR